MAKFRRIKSRMNEFGEVFDNNPEWQKGFEFYSEDFNCDETLGETFVVDRHNGKIHRLESVERID